MNIAILFSFIGCLVWYSTSKYFATSEWNFLQKILPSKFLKNLFGWILVAISSGLLVNKFGWFTGLLVSSFIVSACIGLLLIAKPYLKVFMASSLLILLILIVLQLF